MQQPAVDSGKLRGVLAAASIALFVVQLDYFALNLALHRHGRETVPRHVDLPVS